MWPIFNTTSLSQETLPIRMTPWPPSSLQHPPPLLKLGGWWDEGAVLKTHIYLQRHIKTVIMNSISFRIHNAQCTNTQCIIHQLYIPHVTPYTLHYTPYPIPLYLMQFLNPHRPLFIITHDTCAHYVVPHHPPPLCLGYDMVHGQLGGG